MGVSSGVECKAVRNESNKRSDSERENRRRERESMFNQPCNLPFSPALFAESVSSSTEEREREREGARERGKHDVSFWHRNACMEACEADFEFNTHTPLGAS